MKRIKTFRIFESGISNRLVEDLKKEIQSLMEDRYSPNTRRIRRSIYTRKSWKSWCEI